MAQFLIKFSSVRVHENPASSFSVFQIGRKTGERIMDAPVKNAWVIRNILYMKN
jgi:hypothetical protein